MTTYAINAGAGGMTFITTTKASPNVEVHHNTPDGYRETWSRQDAAEALRECRAEGIPCTPFKTGLCAKCKQETKDCTCPLPSETSLCDCCGRAQAAQGSEYCTTCLLDAGAQ